MILNNRRKTVNNKFGIVIGIELSYRRKSSKYSYAIISCRRSFAFNLNVGVTDGNDYAYYIGKSSRNL